MVSASRWWQTLFSILTTLEVGSIDYTLIGSTALLAQGITSSIPDTLEISIQWDLLLRACELFEPAAKIERHVDYECFHFQQWDMTITLYGYLNTVVVTDPNRLAIEHDEKILWVKAVDAYLQTVPKNDPTVQSIKVYLQKIQQQNSQLNQAAWNQDAYDAWVQRHGTPQLLAERIQKDPWARLATLHPYLGSSIEHKKVINLLGSHGAKAIALALLGAEITIVDISQENAQYAREVAAAAQIPIRYLVADVLNLPAKELDSSYDMVLMELGILHYFIDLEPLALVVQQLLRPGGRLILQDFHPVSTKLISSKGKKHKVTGNYFDKKLLVTNVAFSKHLAAGEQQTPQQVYLRQWGLGEIVTAFAAVGLFIRHLAEEPNSKIDDIGLPKTFTLVAEKLTMDIPPFVI